MHIRRINRPDRRGSSRKVSLSCEDGGFYYPAPVEEAELKAEQQPKKQDKQQAA